MSDEQPSGLRERKKQRTRADLSWAAVRLSVEHGFEAVLVADIADAVGVSPRTFNNYFASKAEAVTARHLDRMLAVADVLRERPAEEPLWDSLTAAALASAEGSSFVPDASWLQGVRLMVAHPALQAEMLRAGAVAQRELAAAIGARTGTDPERELYPKLAAATFGAAVQTAMTHWSHSDPPTGFEPIVRDVLAGVAAGLPEPKQGAKCRTR